MRELSKKELKKSVKATKATSKKAVAKPDITLPPRQIYFNITITGPDGSVYSNSSGHVMPDGANYHVDTNWRPN